LISPSITPKLDLSLKYILFVNVSLVKIQRFVSFHVQLTKILFAGSSMVSVPPKLRALALGVHEAKAMIAVAIIKRFFICV
jgi:hypothetical protein